MNKWIYDEVLFASNDMDLDKIQVQVHVLVQVQIWPNSRIQGSGILKFGNNIWVYESKIDKNVQRTSNYIVFHRNKSIR